MSETRDYHKKKPCLETTRKRKRLNQTTQGRFQPVDSKPSIFSVEIVKRTYENKNAVDVLTSKHNGVGLPK